MPKKNGSPLASTQVERPRRESTRASPSASGEGQLSVSRAIRSRTSSSWRALPATSSACTIAARAAGVSSAKPCMPRPTIDSQGAGFGASKDMTFRILILGGTSEGRRLAERLASAAPYSALLSYAGRTANLQRPSVPHRIGGFGGVSGLVQHLREERVEALVDATHPFAAQMSEHAATAAQLTGTPLLRVEPPAWPRQPGDAWSA